MTDPLETLDLMSWRCECGARMQSTTQLFKTGEKWITCEGMHKTIMKPTVKLMPRNTSTGEYLIGGSLEQARQYQKSHAYPFSEGDEHPSEGNSEFVEWCPSTTDKLGPLIGAPAIGRFISKKKI